MAPEETAAQVFRDVERHVKDERGQNRFASAEYIMDAAVDSNTTVDRRLKPGIMHRPKDEAMLHNLEPSRREYMIQYFGDAKVRERRQKEILAEELLRQNRQARSAVSPASSTRPPTSSIRKGKKADSSSVDVSHNNKEFRSETAEEVMGSAGGSDEHLIHPSRRANSRAGSATPSKRWESSSDELEVWNAVRTRPFSAAANLPVEYIAASSSVVAAKYLPRGLSERPQSSSSHRQREEGLSFAEMVAKRRDQLLTEARSSRCDPVQEEHDGKDQIAAVPEVPEQIQPDPSSLVSIIDPSDGLYQNRSKLVKVVSQSSGAHESGPTTITTAAYLPTSGNGARDGSAKHAKSSKPVSQSTSKTRLKLQFCVGSKEFSANSSEKTAGVEAAARVNDPVVSQEGVPSGWSPAPSPTAQSSPSRGRVIATGTSSGAASVATAASVRVQKYQSGRTSP